MEVRRALTKGDELERRSGARGRGGGGGGEVSAVEAAGVLLLSKGLEAVIFSRPADWFNNDSNFSEAVQQALGLREAVVKHQDKLPLTAKTISLSRWRPETAG